MSHTPAPIQVGAFVNDGPATEAEAREAFAALGWTIDAAEDAEQGIWLVYPDAAFRRTLGRWGHVERHAGNVDILAEMP